MVEFFQTVMGHAFYEGTMPQIAKSLSRIAGALEKANEQHERQEQEARRRKDAGEEHSGSADRITGARVPAKQLDEM